MQKAFKDIVERLEEREKYFESHLNCDMDFGYLQAYTVAIEIVNQVAGEYKQEVCEWKPNEYEDVYTTKCGLMHSFIDGNVQENGYVFCPYCGKKIKVI